MPAARLDLHIEQGATYSKPIIIKEGGVPMDLVCQDKVTPLTPYGEIRKTHRSPDVIAEFSFDIPTTGQTLADGAMTIKLTSTQTAAIACGELETDQRSKYVYDIQLSDTTTTPPTIMRLLQGDVYISPSVTRES
jgi:hypothetical protein